MSASCCGRKPKRSRWCSGRPSCVISTRGSDEIGSKTEAAHAGKLERPTWLRGYVCWEHLVEHHDPLTDVYSLGLILASLACSLDLADPGGSPAVRRASQQSVRIDARPASGVRQGDSGDDRTRSSEAAAGSAGAAQAFGKLPRPRGRFRNRPGPRARLRQRGAGRQTPDHSRKAAGAAVRGQPPQSAARFQADDAVGQPHAGVDPARLRLQERPRRINLSSGTEPFLATCSRGTRFRSTSI